MEIIGSFHAKTHLPQLLERVAKGESFTITKYGLPVAELRPTSATAPRRSFADLTAELRRIRERCAVGGPSIKEMINEGRRF